jgi:hypothetical protein
MRGDSISYRISTHAELRYRERVEPAAAPTQARNAIRQILRSGHPSSRPQKWMRPFTTTRPGTSFVYSSDAPGVCLIVENQTVLTVFTRWVCNRWAKTGDVTKPRTPWRSRRAPYKRLRAGDWTWNEDDG